MYYLNSLSHIIHFRKIALLSTFLFFIQFIEIKSVIPKPHRIKKNKKTLNIAKVIF